MPEQLVALELSQVASASCPTFNESGLMERLTAGGASFPVRDEEEPDVVCPPLFAEHAPSNTVMSKPVTA
jgi:hypothetical protein